jgi:hypothetical protein
MRLLAAVAVALVTVGASQPGPTGSAELLGQPAKAFVDFEANTGRVIKAPAGVVIGL